MLPAIPTHVPFNIEDPRRRSFPGPLQGRKNILEEGDPDRLQHDTNIVAAPDYSGVAGLLQLHASPRQFCLRTIHASFET